MNRKIRITLSFVILLLLWQGLSVGLANDVLLPSPMAVGSKMLHQLQNELFYTAVFSTFLRVLSGFVIALLTALITALLTYLYPVIADYLYPLLLLTRSVPNISYILIVLFWCSPKTSVIVISFLILFPTVYTNLYQGLCACPKEYSDVMKLYPGSRLFDVRHVYLPYLRGYLYTSASIGISLALKVGIMAEILGQANDGIGRQLNLCRLDLDTSGIFAWTIWIIVLLFTADRLLAEMKRLFDKNNHKNRIRQY